jgi:hypothetical protein
VDDVVSIDTLAAVAAVRLLAAVVVGLFPAMVVAPGRRPAGAAPVPASGRHGGDRVTAR